MTTEALGQLDTAGAVLDFARTRRADADRAEADVLQAAVQWAAMHSVDSIDEAEMHIGYGDQGLPLAGAGAPWVAEFSVTEFAAALGLSTDAGKRYVGHALELRYRLPWVWGRVQTGGLRPWLARRIADKTLLLTMEAAGFVDRHVAPTAHRIGPVQLDRLVDEAIGRFMPDEAERRRREHADGRYFTVESRQVNSFDGTLAVHGELDLLDAIELETAIQSVAAQLKDLGSEESLDVRRSQAVGELARRQLAFDLTDSSVVEEGAPHPSRNHLRKIVLYVHLSQDALTARLERGSQLITPGQLKQWCGNASSVVVKPVLDPTVHDPTATPIVPERHREVIAVRDHTCVFPWCTSPARSCDADHIVPSSRGGPTCPYNEASLCRRHHRLKTFSGWTYAALDAGTYLWRSPHGYSYLRDPAGTSDTTPT